MSRQLILIAILTGAGLVACSPGANPKRPAAVPASASWVGNVEGGSWIDCAPLPSTPDRYSCRAWFPDTGAMISEGQYLLRHRKWNQQALRSEYSVPVSSGLPDFKAFDGRWITLQGDHVLLPDGVISYPDSPEHGKRQTYSLGVETGAVEAY